MTSEQFKKEICEKLEILRGCYEELHKRQHQVFLQEDYIRKVSSDIFYLVQEADKLNKIV